LRDELCFLGLDHPVTGFGAEGFGSEM
jgi:hypothetical protein